MNPTLVIAAMRGIVDLVEQMQAQLQRLSASHFGFLAALRGEGDTGGGAAFDPVALERASAAIAELERMLALEPGELDTDK